jgi:hypothetical protein
MTEFEKLDQDYGDVARIVTIRLNPTDAKERKALEHLRKHEAKGEKPRQIIADALAGAADRDDRLEQVLRLQREILSKIEQGGVPSAQDVQALTEQTEVPDKMAQGLLKMRKPMKRRDSNES